MEDDWKTWEGVRAVREDCDRQASDEGLEGIEKFFRVQRLFEDRLNQRPSFAQKCREFRERSATNRVDNALTADEIEWLADRLAGVNDPIGVAILSKLKGGN